MGAEQGTGLPRSVFVLGGIALALIAAGGIYLALTGRSPGLGPDESRGPGAGARVGASPGSDAAGAASSAAASSGSDAVGASRPRRRGESSGSRRSTVGSARPAAGRGGAPPGLPQRVRVVSSPPGATVAIEGIAVGQAPVTVGRPAAGKTVTVSLRLAGHGPREVRLTHDQSGDLRVRLRPLPAHPRRPASRPRPARDGPGADDLDMMLD